MTERREDKTCLSEKSCGTESLICPVPDVGTREQEMRKQSVLEGKSQQPCLSRKTFTYFNVFLATTITPTLSRFFYFYNKVHAQK